MASDCGFAGCRTCTPARQRAERVQLQPETVETTAFTPEEQLINERVAAARRRGDYYR